jgi:hypothetical protein
MRDKTRCTVRNHCSAMLTCKLTLHCAASGTLCNTPTLHQGTEGAVDVSYTVGGGTSTATVHSDYTVAGSGVLRFEPRQTSASFIITILQDSLVSSTLTCCCNR